MSKHPRPRQWHIEAVCELPAPIGPDEALQVVEDLRRGHAAVALGADGTRLEVSMSVAADAAADAAAWAHDLLVSLPAVEPAAICWLQVGCEDSPDAQPNSVPALVGAAEVAALAGLTRQRVHQLASQASFPAVAARVGKRSLWRRRDVQDWLASR